MFTIALIGGDGAGKSKISKMLMKRFPRKLACLYMGVNISSSNVALPTSRIRECFRDKPVKKRWYWKCTRLLNRLAEEWFRQYLARTYSEQGFVVLFDRHFLFDYARSAEEADAEYKRRSWDDRLHRWLLFRYYPKPDMTIFLHAPAKVLFARKRESSIEDLERLQQTYLNQGKKTENFFVVDAGQPLEDLYNEVSQTIMAFYESRNGVENGAIKKKEKRIKNEFV